MSNLFNKLLPAEALFKKTAKTGKIEAIEASKDVAGSDFKQAHHFAGAGNELASVKHNVAADGTVTDSKTAFYNGSQNVSERKAVATPAVIGGSTGTPITDVAITVSTVATQTGADGAKEVTAATFAGVTLATTDTTTALSTGDKVVFTATALADHTVNGKATDTITYTVA